MKIESSFQRFLDSEGVVYEMLSDCLFRFPENDIMMEVVPLGKSVVRNDDGRKYLFEDVWRRNEDVVRARVLAHLGRFTGIFARKCEVSRLDTPQSNDFLSKYHTYGAARSKYRYGLIAEGKLVCVATFSSGRQMNIDRHVESYEWVRYASLPGVRVVGGMGKLMNAFIDDVHPGEIMSYADLEWSEGMVYKSLGFVEAGFRPPVDFYVNTETWERISLRKLECDRAYRKKALDNESLVKISNLGSIKYLKTI